MSKVTTLTRSINSEIISKLFIKLSSCYGHAWTSRHKTDAQWLECNRTWLNELVSFDLYDLKKAVAQSFSLYKEFPPTLSQLVDLCLKVSGIPSEYDVIACMIKRDFIHPLVKIIYDRIGNWTLSHAKSEEIKSKVSSCYAECLIEFRKNQKSHWDLLNQYKEQKSLEAPEPSKIPSNSERISFAERLKQYSKIAEEGKMKLKDQKHPEFPEDKIKKGHRNFDEAVFLEYKKYLISVPEVLVLSLPISYAYARTRFLTEIEVCRSLKESGYNPTQRVDNKVPPRRSSGPQKIYQNWSGD